MRYMNKIYFILFYFVGIKCSFENITEVIISDFNKKNSCLKFNMKKSVFLLGNKWKNMPDDISQCQQYCKLVDNSTMADIIIWHIHTEAEPKKSFMSQKLIAFGMEPKNLNGDNFLSKNVDFVSSFRLDFDIPFLYLDYNFIEKLFQLKIPTEEEFKKMGSVLFISSNCYERERNQFVRRLGKIIHIDSRGSCNNNSLPLNGDWLTIEAQVFGKYKFYLGFEKDLNHDYVSEKFQTGFLINSVPIYRGSKRAFDFAPGENSLIFVDDFKTPEELGAYLKTISSNYSQWKSYFSYREKAVSENTSIIAKWLNYVKLSQSGRDKGNLCRFCDSVCFFESANI